MCCHPLFQYGRQVSISVKTSKPPCAVIVQPGPYFGQGCWLSWLPRSKSQLYQSWPSQIWRFSAVPDWNDSFSGCMLLSGYPSSCCQTLRHCWQYRCVHWLIVAGTCSTPLEVKCNKANNLYPLQKVSRKSMPPQVLGIYNVTLSSFFLTLEQVFMPLDLFSFAVSSTQIEMGPI